MEVRIGDKIHIVEMVGESDYSGKIGIDMTTSNFLIGCSILRLFHVY